MATLWFGLLWFMLVVYAVLDGFDLGTGILHLRVARTDEERRVVLAAIGPLWDGNEVWLVGFGGLLVFAFPKVYAVAASGFYLTLMIVLWLLVVRGVSIELRHHQDSPLWRGFWDVTFAAGSTLLAFLFGVALGDLLRGFPIDPSGYFRAPLFGDFLPTSASGALDWYTLGMGIYAVLALAGHGALYLQWKTAGAVGARAGQVARRLWPLIVFAGAVMATETVLVQPRPLLPASARVLLPVAVAWTVASLVTLFFALRRRAELAAFLASSAYLVGALGAAAISLYPVVLRSTVDPRLDITVHDAAAERGTLLIGLGWWIPAVALAIGYFAYLFRSFRGKVGTAGSGY